MAVIIRMNLVTIVVKNVLQIFLINSLYKQTKIEKKMKYTTVLTDRLVRSSLIKKENRKSSARLSATMLAIVSMDTSKNARESFLLIKKKTINKIIRYTTATWDDQLLNRKITGIITIIMCDRILLKVGLISRVK